MITKKPWGNTECVMQTPFVEVHRIDVTPGGRCSWHTHERKWNAFLVVSGGLRIESGKINKELAKGDFLTMPPGECHRFVGVEECGAIAYELYYPAELSEDIVRFNTAIHQEDVA